MKIAQSRKNNPTNQKNRVFLEKNIQIIEQLIRFPCLHLIQQCSLHEVFT